MAETKEGIIQEASAEELLQELLKRCETKSLHFANKEEENFWNCIRFMTCLDKREVVEASKDVDESFAMRVNALVPDQVDLRQVKCVLWALSELQRDAIAEEARDCFAFDFMRKKC